MDSVGRIVGLHSNIRDWIRWLVYAFVAAIPIEGIVQLPGVGSLSRVVGALAFYCGIAVIPFLVDLRKVRVEHYLLACFVLWAGMTVVWSVAPLLTIQRFYVYVQLLFMVWLFWEFCDERRSVRNACQAYVIGSVCAAVAIVYALLTFNISISGTNEVRISAFGINPNEQALGLVMALPMAAYLADRSRGLLRWLNVAYLPLVVAATVILASRGGFIALAVASLGSLGLFWKARSSVMFFAFLSFLLVIGATGLAVLPANVTNRLFQIGSELSAGDLNGRVEIWRAGIEALPTAFFTGIGSGAYLKISGAVLAIPMSAHSTYLSVLVETGVIGFCLLFGCLSIIVLRTIVAGAMDRAFLLSLILPLSIGALATQWDYRKPLWLAIAIALGFLYSRREERLDLANR